MEKEQTCHEGTGKHKDRTPEERKRLLNRLKRMEGQIRGIEKMIEEDVYCTDVLVQVAAVSSALNGFSRELLSNHVRTCVADGIRNGDEEVVEELLDLMRKLMK